MKKKCYEIINLDRKHFKPKCYKKEKYNNVTIFVGELKNKHAKIHGGGIMSDIFNKVKNKIVDTFSVKLDFNNASNKMFKTFGNIPIERISIYKTPISNVYKTLINKVSRSGLDEMMKTMVLMYYFI
jgi:hypothetical protein